MFYNLLKSTTFQLVAWRRIFYLNHIIDLNIRISSHIELKIGVPATKSGKSKTTLYWFWTCFRLAGVALNLLYTNGLNACYLPIGVITFCRHCFCNEWNERIFCFKNQCACVWHINISVSIAIWLRKWRELFFVHSHNRGSRRRWEKYGKTATARKSIIGVGLSPDCDAKTCYSQSRSIGENKGNRETPLVKMTRPKYYSSSTSRCLRGVWSVKAADHWSGVCKSMSATQT